MTKGKRGPKREYTDPPEGGTTCKALDLLKTWGLTAQEAYDKLSIVSMTTVLNNLRDMHGYDIRSTNVPRDHSRATRGRVTLLYFCAGRWNWDHSEYESYVDEESLTLHLGNCK